MRSSKNRSRSKQNRPRTLGNIINRVFDSSGPEGKVRGTPQQIIEKYQLLARDAQLSNDRVAAENFLQHAEHYTRLLAEAMREQAAEQEARQQYQSQNQNGNGNGNGGNRDRDYRNDRSDYRPEYRNDQPDEGTGYAASAEGFAVVGEDDSHLVELPETPRAQPRREDNRGNDQRNSENRRRDDRPRDNRPRDERPREERPRDERPRDERPRDERPREDRPRDENRREDRPREENRRREAAPQPELPAFITGTPADPVAAVETAPKEAKPRISRPRKPAVKAEGDTAKAPDSPETAE